MLVVHPVERQSGGVLQSSRVNTIAEDSRSSKANSWCRNRLRRICSSQVPLQYRVVELGTWARQRQKRLKTLTISQSRILQNRVVQDNEMRDARRLLPTNAAYVSSHSPGDQYHSECAEQSKLTSCAHQQAHQQSLCTSTVTVHISSYCAHQQSLCTSAVTSAVIVRTGKLDILEKLQLHGLCQGTVLELGSGTGQHAAYISSQCPQLCWYPSDGSLHNLQTIGEC